MRSNKTAELLRRIETRREYAKQYVMLLKPSADTKAAAGRGRKPQSQRLRKDGSRRVPFCDPWSVLPVIRATEQRIGKRIECIAIDEGPVRPGSLSVHQAAARLGLRRDGFGPRTRFSRHAVRRDARSFVAGAHLCGQRHRAGGLLQLRSQGAVSAAAGRWQARRTTPAPSSWPATTTSRAARSILCCPGRPH